MDDAAQARFKREIVALGQLGHPNLVRMLDHGIDAELGPYLVLPLLAGANLRALCAGRAICPEAALLLIQPVVHATAALHAANYVHRDLKPENVIAAPDGAITVIDLGLAWRDGMTRHTDTGTAVGSVGYMAPEQIEGRVVDRSADVWALGVMLYEMIVGKRPFARARPAEEAAAALLGTCSKLTAADRRTSDELGELVARCFALDPTVRPAAAELATAIDGWIDWTDAVSDERAAAVADPGAYQARVASFRIRRVERLAREALDAGAPFEALAHCDRGLAYAPDHAGLLALVADAEAATSKAKPVEPPRAASVMPAPPSQRWLWIGIATIVVVVGVGATVRLLSAGSSSGSDPWAAPSASLPTTAPTSRPDVTTTRLVPDERDRKLVGDFVSVFSRAIDAKEAADRAGSGSGSGSKQMDPALARDMIGLFGEAFERARATEPAKVQP
jgi:hypothetical protein